MISGDEIDAAAKDLDISVANVERDYVFGWLISGIFQESNLGQELVLKCGNALRKGYLCSHAIIRWTFDAQHQNRLTSLSQLRSPGDIASLGHGHSPFPLQRAHCTASRIVRTIVGQDGPELLENRLAFENKAYGDSSANVTSVHARLSQGVLAKSHYAR